MQKNEWLTQRCKEIQLQKHDLSNLPKKGDSLSDTQRNLITEVKRKKNAWMSDMQTKPVGMNVTTIEITDCMAIYNRRSKECYKRNQRWQTEPCNYYSECLKLIDENITTA